MLLNLLSEYPKAKRKISSRLKNKKFNREIAKKFGKEYFDGPRSQGYGGYKYDGRWVSIAKEIINHYKLGDNSKILDIGCAKGFLVKDLMDISSKIQAYGIDVSEYAIKNCHPNVIGRVHCGNAISLPFPNNSFDFVISINTIHNLSINDCKKALKEIIRVSKSNKYFIQVDAYYNEKDKKKFIDWMLTAKTYGTPEEWLRILDEINYKGDYYWTTM